MFSYTVEYKGVFETYICLPTKTVIQVQKKKRPHHRSDSEFQKQEEEKW